MGTVINHHGFMEILRGFLTKCEILSKRFKHGINVIADV